MAQELTLMIKTLKESTDRIEKSLADVIQQNEQKDTSNELNRKCILAIMDSLHSISEWIQASNGDKAKMKKRISKSMESLEKWKRQLSPKNDTSMKSINESPQPPANGNTANSIITTNDVFSNILDRQNVEEEPTLNPSS